MTLDNILSQTGIQAIRYNEPLRNHCSWRIGGPADALVEPAATEELAALLRVIHEHTLRSVVIGDGSNVLFSDAGFRGVVIQLGRRLAAWSIDGTTVRVQAGMAVPRLARLAALAGLTGLEHTAGIPGTIGGLVAMNGGSLQQSIGDAVKTVSCLDPSGRLLRLERGDCGFAYRHSIFLQKPWIVTEAVLELQRGSQPDIVQRTLGVLRERRQKFPRRWPNCGSVFKRHPALFETCGPPGRIIEDLGLKGTRIGDAEVSRLHANFIINKGAATAADVQALIGLIREKVHAKTGVWLECEVRIVE